MIWWNLVIYPCKRYSGIICSIWKKQSWTRITRKVIWFVWFQTIQYTYREFRTPPLLKFALCFSESESSEDLFLTVHLFGKCRVNGSRWLTWVRFLRLLSISYATLVGRLLNCGTSADMRLSVWRERNLRIFENQFGDFCLDSLYFLWGVGLKLAKLFPCTHLGFDLS